MERERQQSSPDLTSTPPQQNKFTGLKVKRKPVKERIRRVQTKLTTLGQKQDEILASLKTLVDKTDGPQRMEDFSEPVQDG